MAEFTVTMSVYVHIEAEDMIAAATAVEATLPTGANVLNLQVSSGHSTFG